MEGTPNTVLEAAAAGLPVVATRHAGIPDIVLDGDTGLLVDEHDIDGMAEKMCQIPAQPDILAQPDQARAMGAAGRQRMRTQFMQERSLNVVNQCISRAVGGPRSGTALEE
jgi:glycosyltransferase involved in cell wall biosynthesis